MENFLNVGKIVNTHGLKGEVKVVRITDFEDRFEPGNTLYFFYENSKDPIQLKIQTHRMHKQFDLLQFESYDSINQVEDFKRGMLAISRDQTETLTDGDYYYYEIIGCNVETTEGEALGEIVEVLAPGANDVWIVRRANQKDLLIPYIDQVVKEVDTVAKKVVIEPMEGLLS